MMRWCLVLGMIAFAAPIASACRFCSGPVQSPTFRQETKQTGARIIVSGTIANSRIEGDAGSTDFYIETTLRADPVMKGKTSLVLNRYLPIEKPNYPPRYVLFCDVEKGKVGAFRGVVVQRAASVEYVKKAIAFDASDPVKTLVFFFGYLDDPDPEVAKDAFNEFSLADDAPIGAAGRKLDADKLRRWLRDPKTPMARIGLYAKLLAAAGTAKDATILEAILDSPTREAGTGLDSILVGYIMLAPENGWAYARAILGNPNEEFSRRYAALRAVRYLVGSRTGVVTNGQMTTAYRLLLTHEDMVELVIEDLRQWKRWDLADAILPLAETKVHNVPIVRRTMILYALQCKGSAAATAYVAVSRKADPEALDDAQELLDLETAVAKRRADIPNE